MLLCESIFLPNRFDPGCSVKIDWINSTFLFSFLKKIVLSCVGSKLDLHHTRLGHVAQLVDVGGGGRGCQIGSAFTATVLLLCFYLYWY